MPSLNSHTFARSPRRFRPIRPITPRAIASAYNHVGDGYRCYADGEGLDDPCEGPSRFAHADAIVWETIRKTIDQLRGAGVPTLRVLDAGCGPGTWIRRVAVYAHHQGLAVEAVGLDISSGQLEIARKHAESLSARYPDDRSKLEFVMHDLADPLPWPDGHFHMVLCNYVVLNHLPKMALPRVIEDLCRVATYRVISTVRALASPPTGCIIGTEQVREYHQDCGRGELKLALKDGTEHVLTFNFYSAETLKALFQPHAKIVDLRAIDLFLSRFAPDANWTANLVNCLTGRQEVIRKLQEIEETLCRQDGWVDHGTHVLIVAQPNSSG
jgi:ubiquinone/menaquinone biosynthesis C-methylase UbiE